MNNRLRLYEIRNSLSPWQIQNFGKCLCCCLTTIDVISHVRYNTQTHYS